MFWIGSICLTDNRHAHTENFATAIVLDIVTSVVLVLLGSLALAHIFSLPPAASYIMIGAGCLNLLPHFLVQAHRICDNYLKSRNKKFRAEQNGQIE